MEKFKKEGIDKIIDAYDDDIKPLFDRLEQLQKLSEEYDSFSGIADGVEGEVKFIYETAAIEAKDE